MVRTLWGELAWQLGGKRAFERVRADDENATSPGDVLRERFALRSNWTFRPRKLMLFLPTLLYNVWKSIEFD
jgi:hypothetical protein